MTQVDSLSRKIADALRFVFEAADTNGYSLGEYEAFFFEADQVTEYRCSGCDAIGYAKWPDWKVHFTHSDDCRYVAARAALSGLGVK